MDVTRYDPDIIGDGYAFGDARPTMSESSTGGYVDYADYEHLTTERDALRAAAYERIEERKQLVEALRITTEKWIAALRQGGRGVMTEDKCVFPFYSASITDGLTNRELFAAMAMQGFCSNSAIDSATFDGMAKHAVMQADALITALRITSVLNKETNS